MRKQFNDLLQDQNYRTYVHSHGVFYERNIKLADQLFGRESSFLGDFTKLTCTVINGGTIENNTSKKLASYRYTDHIREKIEYSTDLKKVRFDIGKDIIKSLGLSGKIPDKVSENWARKYFTKRVYEDGSTIIYGTYKKEKPFLEEVPFLSKSSSENSSKLSSLEKLCIYIRSCDTGASLREKIRYEHFKDLTKTNTSRFGKSIAVREESEIQFKFLKSAIQKYINTYLRDLYKKRKEF